MAERAPRVGFLIDRWQPERGGAERALAQLARHLESESWDVLAFGLEGPTKGTTAPGAFHAVSATGLSRSARERSLSRNMIRTATREQCDVTVGVRHVTDVDVLWSHGGSHLATLDASGRKPTGRHKTFIDLERAALEGGASTVVCPSQLVRDEFAHFYPDSTPRLEVIPNGVDLDEFHPREREARGAALRAELQLDARVPLFVFAARHPERKGLEELFSALTELQVPWHLLVAGPRDADEWQGRARVAGLGGERVSTRAHVDPITLAAGADVCVLPTWRDTSGLVLLEALAAGTPVVTTSLAGAADVVTSPAAGEVVASPEDTAALRAALERACARVLAKNVDRNVVRAHVEKRGHGPWLAALTAVLQRHARKA